MQIEASRLVVVILALILSIATIKTLVPSSDASKACLLGYHATCSFAPVSTLILGLAAFGVAYLAWRMA